MVSILVKRKFSKKFCFLLWSHHVSQTAEWQYWRMGDWWKFKVKFLNEDAHLKEEGIFVRLPHRKDLADHLGGDA